MKNNERYRVANLAAPAQVDVKESLPTILFDPAYSGGLLRMNPDVWPLPTVFDVDGLEERPQEVPIIRDHDQNQKVGQTDRIEYADGKIVATGTLINFGVDPAASKIVQLWKRGARLQASVATGIIPPENIESVPPGAVAVANGRTFEGPIEIVRKWRLKEISIVTLGADDEGTRVVVGNASGNFNAQKGKTKMKKWPALMSALGLAPTASRPAALKRIARAASDPGTAPLDPEVVEQVLEETLGAEAEGEIDPADPQFVAFAAELGIDDVASAPPEALEVAKAAFARFGAAEGEADPDKTGAAEGETDPDKTGAAEGETDPDKTGAAEDGDDSNKTGAASRGLSGVRPWTRTRFPVDALGSFSQKFPGTRRPSAARVAEAALLGTSGATGAELTRLGYSETEIDEASRSDRRGVTVRGLLYETGAVRGGYARSATDVADALRRAGRKAEASGYRVGSAAGPLSTVDIPGVLSNVLHKSLILGTQSIDDPTDKLAKTVAASDFKDMYFVDLLTEGEFDRVKKNAEIESLKISDETYRNKPSLRGFEATFSFEDVANDDMSALTEVPKIMGRKAVLRKQRIFWETLCGYLDGVASPDKNPALSLKGLDAASATFDALQDSDGDPIGGAAKFLIVPTALKATAFNLVNATQIVAAGGGSGDVVALPNANRFSSMFEIVATPYLGTKSRNAKKWSDAGYMLLASPDDRPLMTICYYKDQRSPTLETAYGQLKIDGLRVACYWGFGVAGAKKNAAVFSTGAGS